MEDKRRNFQSKLNDEIKYNERMIVTLKKSIENIQTTLSASRDLAFYENRIHQSEMSISNYEDANERMRQKLTIVMSGGCDAEILKKQKDIEDELKKKEENAIKEKAEELKRDETRKSCSKKFDMREREQNRRDYGAKKDMDRGYQRFFDIVETAPDYIINNVKTMPNNKGYRFKGVIFYGQLPAERNAPIVVFDRKPNGMMITETYSDQEMVYFKPRDSNQKELVSRHRLVKNVNAPATRIRI
jgi:hypothetical protein